MEKSIRESDLGLNPQTEGQLIRIAIPDLSEERRIEIRKIASKYAEQGRVAVRNVRRDGMDDLKKAEKTGTISQDDQRLWGDELQQMTNKYVKKLMMRLLKKKKRLCRFRHCSKLWSMEIKRFLTT